MEIETKNSNIISSKFKKGRPDAPLKVSGHAMYTADYSFKDMAYAVPVCATIGKGKIKTLDLSKAQKMPGVLGVYAHGSIGKLFRPAPEEGFSSRMDEARPPFEDEEIRYYGQFVAVVVGETLEAAQAGADKVHVTYVAEIPNIDPNLKQEDEKKIESRRGDAASAFQKAAVQIDETYVTPIETHNPIEMHATVAVWEAEDRVTLYESTQALMNHQSVLTQVLGLPRGHVRVISKFLGSGFGGKLWPWPHSTLAAATARILKRPVKLMVDRRMMFMNVGHRPRTQQHFQIGAQKNGKLVSMHQEYASQASMLENYKENCGEATPYMYSVANLLVTSGLARRNQSVPTSMRGPGAVPGLFAMESAMDELAVKLNMDPVQLRLMNEPEIDESNNLPFSSRHLKECLALGSKKFDWDKRNPVVGSMKKGDEILGWGMAACSWGARRLPCQATVEFREDGKVRVSSATQDIGTGTYSVLAQIVHEETGVELEMIEIVLGDTDLPPGPLSGGSMATASVIPAVAQASRDAVKTLLKVAATMPASPFHGHKPEELHLEKGEVTDKKKKVTFPEILNAANMGVITGRGSSEGTAAQKEPKVSSHSFGAHFMEVAWQPELARLRVSRVVTVIDAGRMISPVPARNQIEGAIVMGIGMGLFEQTIYDPRFGNPVNNNLADYVMVSHADCPDIDVSFVDFPDKNLNEYGARGVGEIGLAGTAAALCSAVYHATGVRIRELPVQIEKILAAQTVKMT